MFVSGIVTFASNQSFAGVSYDTLVVKKVANFWGYNTSGGVSDQGIPWENYGHYTIVDEGGTARLNDMEVVGTYATFKPSVAHVEGPYKSTYAGVSTWSGTVEFGNINVNNGTIYGYNLLGVNAGIDTL